MTVYVTIGRQNNPQRYHLWEGCTHVLQSSDYRETTYREAEHWGRTVCKTCAGVEKTPPGSTEWHDINAKLRNGIDL